MKTKNSTTKCDMRHNDDIYLFATKKGFKTESRKHKCGIQYSSEFVTVQ